MAGQLLTGTLLDADRLLQRAAEYHFSFRGEIFSGLVHKFINKLVVVKRTKKSTFHISHYLLILFFQNIGCLSL